MTAGSPAVIPAHAGIQCNNESPRPAPACRKAGATQYNTGCRGKPGMTMGGMRRNGGEGMCRNHDRARLASPLVGMAGQGDAFCQVLYCHLQGIGKR